MTINFTFWLVIALVASVTANFFALWYIRKVLGKLMFVGENLADLVLLIANYEKHLKGVYNLEQYYGDEDIKHLVSHTTSLIQVLKEYEDVYSITMPLEIEESEEEQQETIEDAETPINQENVFYAGTRTSNN